MISEANRYVLIVEDDALQGLQLAKTVEEAGFKIAGPFTDGPSALRSIDDNVPDAALLDIRLDGENTTKLVADALSTLGVPFAFVTGFAGDKMRHMPEHVTSCVYSKRCKPADVAHIASKLVARSKARSRTA